MTDLHYRRMGEGRPVVVLHGLFGSGDNWGSVGRELAEDHDVLLVDLRDHGRSPHTDHITYPLMAEDVHRLVTGLGLEDIILVGHSMGGKTAMVFAQHWPGLLRHLVVVDISPREHENNHGHIIRALLEADLSGDDRKAVEEQLLRGIPEPGVVQFLMKGLYRKDGGGFAWRMNVPLLEHDLSHILAAIGPETVRVPTLFIRGGQSNYILREDLPAIKEQFPNGRVETIPYAGHWVHAQAPDEVVSLIRALP
ncbi:MAG: alpha/beta fold hydrolase [Flavobacteriales bacterium]|nr:alpha/beta fold hydrolase [Flavobacteriales bacterium]